MSWLPRLTVDLHLHGPDAEGDAVLSILTRLLTIGERIMVTQDEIVTEIKAAKAEIATAIQVLSDKLAAAVANQTAVTPELQAAADDLKAFADGLTPAPVPPPAP